MKKRLLALLCAVLMLALCACDAAESMSAGTPDPEPDNTAQADKPEETKETEPPLALSEDPVKTADAPAEETPEPEPEPEPTDTPEEPEEPEETEEAPPQNPASVPDSGEKEEQEPEEDADMGTITNPGADESRNAVRLVIKIEENAQTDALEALFAENSLEIVRFMEKHNLYVVRCPETMNSKQIAALMTKLEENDAIQSVTQDGVNEMQ